jgi:HAD superfamily hydrolase (TIGR01509 family)
MKFTTAIFDMDGTLFDSERVAIDCWKDSFEDIGVRVERQELEAVIGVDGPGTRAYLSRFLPVGVNFEELIGHARNVRKVYVEEHGLPMKTGAAELLALLHQRGIRLGLATTTHTERTLENLHRAGFAGYFQVVVCGDQVEHCKPHPEIYLKTLSLIGATPDESIALEDSDHGIMSAFAAGLRVIHVHDIKRINDNSKARVHREYASLLEFRDEIAG